MNNRDLMNLLVETNDVRIGEEMVRPRVEMLVDDFAAWAAYHRAKDEGVEYTPHLGIGWN